MKTHPVCRRSHMVLAILATALVATFIAAGCGSGPTAAERLADQFAAALNAHKVPDAAALTTDPTAAAEVIADVFGALGRDGHFDVKRVNDSDITVAARWKLGDDPAKVDWSYETTAKAVETDAGWKLTWAPSILVPHLEAGGSVAFNPIYPKPVSVLDLTGKPILQEQTVTRVMVKPGSDTAAVAGVLSEIDSTITAQSLDADLAAAKGGNITAVLLRKSDLDMIESSLTKIEGVSLQPEQRLVFVDKSLASPALNGLVDEWTLRRAKAAGWSLQTTDANGKARKIAGGEPGQLADIRTTIDLAVHRAAEAAVTGASQASAIVAFKPSTGEVIAVAQNDAADAIGPIALTGLYPPGSTFKIITASAALASGKVTPDTVLGCPGKANIAGRELPNDEEFDLGDIPLHTAFAKSCNTTFGRLAADMKPDDLTKTAQELGLGVDYVIPGLTTVTGSVPPADQAIERVEDGIGQGKVTASPFGMALVAAGIAHGGAVQPIMVVGSPGSADKSTSGFSPKVAQQLQTMMRETITGGTATDLNDIPGLMGKTGTAEYGDGHAHGWFVGIVGDMAFAVLVAGADSNTPAKNLTGKFLRALKH